MSSANSSEHSSAHKRVLDIKDPSKHIFQGKEGFICLGKILKISYQDSSCHIHKCDDSDK